MKVLVPVEFEGSSELPRDKPSLSSFEGANFERISSREDFGGEVDDEGLVGSSTMPAKRSLSISAADLLDLRTLEYGFSRFVPVAVAEGAGEFVVEYSGTSTVSDLIEV